MKFICFVYFAESLLENLITKDSFKPSAPTLEKITNHVFFKEFNGAFETKHSTFKTILSTNSVSFDAHSKEFLVKLSQKSEQRLKDEQKLVGFSQNMKLKSLRIVLCFNLGEEPETELGFSERETCK